MGTLIYHPAEVTAQRLLVLTATSPNSAGAPQLMMMRAWRNHDISRLTRQPTSVDRALPDGWTAIRRKFTTRANLRRAGDDVISAAKITGGAPYVSTPIACRPALASRRLVAKADEVLFPARPVRDNLRLSQVVPALGKSLGGVELLEVSIESAWRVGLDFVSSSAASHRTKNGLPWLPQLPSVF
jgi:hypothetical protein